MNAKFIGIFLVIAVVFTHPSMAQDCFYPPNGYTLYTTTNPTYLPPAKTGFVTFSTLESGLWSVNSNTGTASGLFTDNSGRTSTLEITGTGSLTIDNTVENFSTNPHTFSACTQTFNVVPYLPVNFNNPDLGVGCPLNVVVVLDESGSIADANIDQAIRDAVLSFAEVLNATGSRMAIVEFDSEASNVPINGSSALQVVNSEFVSNLAIYLANDYQPTEDPINLIGGTNWEDALLKANSVAGATMIMMLTDGNPTFYSFNGMMMGSVSGEGDIFDLTALKESVDQANIIKAAGKHMFVIGVDIPVNVQPILDISGPSAFPLGGTEAEFLSADHIFVSSNQINRVFTDIARLTCGKPIPTLGEWGIIILALCCIIIGVLYIRQEMPTTVSATV